ncbi:MAG: hypothetical protein ACE5JZ_06080 [Kiloniellales bacterium]
MVDLKSLPRRDLEAMAAAADQILECYRVLRKTDDNIVGEVLRGHGTFYEWDHYPPGDVYDQETHAQYYYHAHPVEDRGGEHGHFHTFLRARGMPKGVRPAPLPDYRPPKDKSELLSHLVAISMNRAGYPIRLFTTNRWVTGEVWYPADDVIRMLDRFEIDHARPSWPTNRWITNMLRLFRPHITELVRERDRAVQQWIEKHPDENVYEDRRFEIASMAKISVEAQIEAVTAALRP